MNLRSGLLVMLCVALTVFFYLYLNASSLKDRFGAISGSAEGNVVRDGRTGHSNRFARAVSSTIAIERAWQMPEILKEISGLAYVDENRFACIQDELGTIFIYNTSTEMVEKEIRFGVVDDYEGIAVAGDAAYVVTSNGRITEVSGYRGDKPSTKIYATALTAKENVEGLCYDPKTNNLLLAVKDEDRRSNDYKGIYAFNLSSKEFDARPAFTIDLNSELFATGSKKKSKSSFYPSGISVHPQTGDLYIVDGRRPRLLVLDRSNKIKSVTTLNDKAFSQPEGIAFNPAAELFISNEGTKHSGNILKVRLQ
ncbi:hypothetical protein EXU57_23350 [Segetibacter sp. 3557_3]|uniref:SdiA-regulated domain-containing protein n=1 Tax=Segetibacter sp. 3557_3 TaxID=2547429 RepID=UPI0010584E3B|nr:SdiA-regulated domain-containing protein [Segetibacter sp. 3557_3]TDH18403.1 hypothetical protein EXU57_23350 [Segetibacter sp. 3557_3]